MKKRSIILMTSILLAVLLIGGGTFAFFTWSSGVPIANKFTAGTLALELHDDFDKTKAGNVNPGDCFTKTVYVCNTGTKRAVVRIKAETVFGGNLRCDDTIITNIDTDNWLFKNGYWVYKWVLGPTQCTKPLYKCNSVCFDKRMGNEFMGKTWDINISGEAIQASNNAPKESGWGVYVKWDKYVEKTRGEEGEPVPTDDSLGEVIEEL